MNEHELDIYFSSSISKKMKPLMSSYCGHCSHYRCIYVHKKNSIMYHDGLVWLTHVVYLALGNLGDANLAHCAFWS